MDQNSTTEHRVGEGIAYINADLSVERQQMLLLILRDHKTVFQERTGCAQLPPLQITLKDPRLPPYASRQNMPKKMNDRAVVAAKKLMKQRRIRLQTSEYCAPTLMIRKPMKADAIVRWRMVNNFIKLNMNLVDNQHPLITIRRCLDALTGAKFFSILDLKDGFWQVPLHPDSQQYTGFRIFQLGSLVWCVVPMGLKTAPKHFIRCIESVLATYLNDFVIVYVDDVIIYSKTWEEHPGHVRLVLKALRNKDVVVSLPKCRWGMTIVVYVGLRISNGTHEVTNQRIQFFQQIPRPQNQKELLSFLGILAYYGRYLPKERVGLEHRMRALAKKNVPFH